MHRTHPNSYERNSSRFFSDSTYNNQRYYVPNIYDITSEPLDYLFLNLLTISWKLCSPDRAIKINQLWT